MNINIQQLMQQAQKMQKKLQENKKVMENSTFEGIASNGNVKITAQGTGEVKSIYINPELCNKDDVDMLQDMLIIAFNDCKQKIDEANKNNLGDMAGLGGMM